MTQLALKPNLEVYTMSPEDFFNTYQSISSNSSHSRAISSAIKEQGRQI
jgi:hypothetical protein